MTPEGQAALLQQLHAEVARLASRIDAPQAMLPLAKGPRDIPWLSIYFHEANDGDDEDGYWLGLFSVEDGQEWCLAEASVECAREVLFKLFEGVTHQMAMQSIASANSERRPELFSAQEQLMRALDVEWGERTRRRHLQILTQSAGSTEQP